MTKYKRSYLTHWDRCEISMRQGVILLAHLGGPQPFRHGVSVSSLLRRCWLRRDTHAGRTTELTVRGKLAAIKATGAIDDRLGPPLAPLEIETAPELAKVES